jgi:hypothetical protein
MDQKPTRIRGSRAGKHVREHQEKQQQGYGDSFALRCITEGGIYNKHYVASSDPAAELDPSVVARMTPKQLQPQFIPNKSLTATAHLRILHGIDLLRQGKPDKYIEDFKRIGARSKRLKADPT